jgi:hypothetical protein
MITMRKRSFIVFILALVCLSAWLAGCTEEKTYDIVIGDSVCPEDEFEQNSASEVFTSTVTVSAGAEIDSVLAENGYTRSDLSSVVLNGATYEVTMYEGATDWVISGSILIQRTDVSPTLEDTLLSYSEASVPGSLHNPQVAAITAAGADIINQAFEDFLDGANPEFTFIVVNGDCEPNPTSENRIVFNWIACLQVQLIGTTTTEVFEPL